MLGGEPLEQLEGTTQLARLAAGLGLGVIVFTGYTLEQARSLPAFPALWSTIDTLVDGPFDARKIEDPRKGRRFLGSHNQGLHHRSARYRELELWTGSRQVELRLSPEGPIEVSGHPELAQKLAQKLAPSSRSQKRPEKTNPAESPPK